jgi:hypothetical protein
LPASSSLQRGRSVTLRKAIGKIQIWGFQGFILQHYLEYEIIVCYAMRQGESFPQNNREYYQKGVLILHDNAESHSVAHTEEILLELKFEVLGHPACSSDLAYSDFHLFGPLNATVRGHRFDDNDVKEAVHKWPCTQPKQFFFLMTS